MEQGKPFQYEVVRTEDAKAGRTATVLFHGKLVAESSREVQEAVKPLIASGGRIILDLTGVEYIDSAGLGTLVALKVSAINKGFCTLEMVNLTPRIKQLLSIANLTQMFSSGG